jgi:hypothetical protein
MGLRVFRWLMVLSLVVGVQTIHLFPILPGPVASRSSWSAFNWKSIHLYALGGTLTHVSFHVDVPSIAIEFDLGIPSVSANNYKERKRASNSLLSSWGPLGRRFLRNLILRCVLQALCLVTPVCTTSSCLKRRRSASSARMASPHALRSKSVFQGCTQSAPPLSLAAPFSLVSDRCTS